MEANHQRTPLNILLADDDIDDRFLFEKALKEIPVASKVTMVNNGEELMEHLIKNSGQLPDIVFLDLSMPRKTGFECLSEIKENENLKALNVVMLTTSFTSGIDLEDNLRSTLLRMGAQDYIRKPSDFKELKQVIEQALINVSEKKHIPFPFL